MKNNFIENIHAKVDAAKKLYSKNKNACRYELEAIAEEIEKELQKDSSLYLKVMLSEVLKDICKICLSYSDQTKFNSIIIDRANRMLELENTEGYGLKAAVAARENNLSAFRLNLEMGAQAGDIICSSELAIIYYEEGKIEEAIPIFEYALEMEDPLAKFNEAIMIFNGDFGHKKDMDLAYSKMIVISNRYSQFSEDVKWIKHLLDEKKGWSRPKGKINFIHYYSLDDEGNNNH